MSYQQRDNSGALFTNKKRGDNQKAPNYTGDALIDGREYRMSAWVKDGKNGKFMSVAFTPKEDGKTIPASQRPSMGRRIPQEPAIDDEIPF